MSSTWVIGDIHGCAEELDQLMQKLALGPEDRLISLGDLYHRGPDPVGVLDLLAQVPKLDLILGNHERTLLRRVRLMGEAADGSDCGTLAENASVEPELLLGDGRTAIGPVPPDRAADLIRFLIGRSYYLEGRAQDQAWVAVHAGLLPGMRARDCHPEDLVRLRRLRRFRGAPYWYEVYRGPELVLFGHTPSPFPRTHFSGGRLVALGLDTGCVYGGSLTAYRLEDGEMEMVKANKNYVGQVHGS
ncbi:MAG: fructose-bisphosphatase class III [Planctomycetota bacterium]|nr:MAG: fructose-bisphosphatase class III [Planctomycetota bacterium]